MKKKRILAAVLALSLLIGATGCDDKEKETTSMSYSWSNVTIGGGGYITGIVYNTGEEGLAYTRTDIGGAWRWDKTQNQWIAITDSLGGVNSDDWNLIGIESIATDPVETKRVYLACGTYMSNNGAILSSDDYGETWTQYDLDFGVGGNQSARGVGERMMVDPNNNSTIYYGTRTEGLWRSTDYGKTWACVESFPVKGDYTQEKNNPGVMWVEFDPSSSDVYVGVAMRDGNCIYKSSDSGTTWEALPANEAGMFPLQADISANGNIYLSYSNTCGPNVDPTDGRVYAYNIASGAFTDITPDVGDGHYGGYGGISVDAQNPDTVVVSSLGFWDGRGENLYRTTDGGKSWNALFDSEGDHYTMDTSGADWLKWGNEEAKIGWWVSDVNINPFNSDEVSYGTGATIYSTTNMTALGTGTDVTIKFNAAGLEETAIFKMISPPAGDGTPQLYSIMGDLTGFSHLDVTVAPDDAHFMKEGVSSDVDCAWLNPNIAAYASDSKSSPVRYTTDGGATWQRTTNLPERAVSGGIAVSADGSSMIWSPSSISATSYVTQDFGETWYICNGLSYNAIVEADRVNPNTYYAVCGGNFFVSTDGGMNFNATGALVAENTTLTVDGTHEGYVWALSGLTIMRSTDGGKTFKSVSNMAANAIGLGAGEKDGDPMVLYALGKEDTLGDGIFRSVDNGATWQKINDDAHQFGNITPSITGDSSIYGRVYFATNGRGIVMGDIAK